MSILLARAFGVDGYGDVTKIATFVAIFYPLADFGMNAVFLQKKDALWAELLGVRLVTSVCLVFLAMALLVFLPQGAGQGYTAVVRLGIIVLLPSVVFQAIVTTTNAAFQKRFRYDLAAVAIIAGSAVTIGAVWILAPTGVIGVIVALGIGAMTTAAAALLFVKPLEGPVRPVLYRSSLADYFTRALPLGMTIAFNLIYFRADQIILALSRQTAEVGLYGLAYKVFEFFLAVPTFVMNSAYPLMVQKANQESARLPARQGIRNQGLRQLFQKMLLAMIPASIFMMLIMWVASPLLTMIRPEFAGSIPALRVLSLGLPFFFLTSLTMWTMIAAKKHMALIGIYGVSMILNVLLNIWLVPQYGYMAAAWVTVSSEAVVLAASVIIHHFLFSRKNPTNPTNNPIRPMNEAMSK